MQDNASGPIKKVGTTAAQTSDDIAKSMGKAGGAYEKFNEKSKRVSNDFQNQQKKLQLLKDKYVELYSTMGSGAAETQKVGAEIEELSGKVAKNKKVLEEAASAADSFDKSIEQVPNTMDKAGKSADGFGSSLEGLIPMLTKAMLIKKSIEAVVDLAGQAVEQASTAETAFAKVSTLLADGTDTTAYFDSIKKGSQETGIAVGDFAEAVYSALSASVDQGHAVEFTTSAMKLTKAGFTDAATAVDVLTTVLNAYGLEASQATRIADKLITTQNLGKTTVGELGQVLGRSIPTARAYNVSIDELCAAYAVMTKNGSPAAESTTLINAMLNELGKSGTKTAEIIKDKTGKSFSQLMSEGVKLTDVLSILQSYASQSGLAINDLFGSTEAGRGANILLNNIKDVNSALNAMENSSGATETAYKKVMATFSEQVAILKNNLNLILEGVGEKLLPIATKVVGRLNDVLTGKAYKNRNGVFEVDAESAEDAYAKAMKYKAVMDDLNSSYSGDNAGMLWSQADSAAYSQAEGYYNAYLALSEEIKQANADVGESGEDMATRMQTAYDDYINGVDGIMQRHEENYQQILANVRSWFGPFEKANQDFTKSYDDIKTSLESQADFFTKYQDNAQYLADNGLGSVVEKLQTMGTDGAEWANAFAEKLKSVGPDGVQGTVDEINTLMDTVSKSQEGLAETLELGSGNMKAELESITESFATTVEGLDKGDEAAQAATSTMDAFLEALEQGGAEALQQMAGLGAQLTAELQANIGPIIATVTVQGAIGGGDIVGKFAIGMDYVPYNEMPAILHRGEAILNSYEADQWRRGRSGGNGQGITIVQNIHATPQTPAQFAATTEAYFQRARWAF